jgi:hypothetical protein
LLELICVGFAVSMVPRYEVSTWKGGIGLFGSCGLGSCGVCTNAAARNVCLPQAIVASAISARRRIIAFPRGDFSRDADRRATRVRFW